VALVVGVGEWGQEGQVPLSPKFSAVRELLESFFVVVKLPKNFRLKTPTSGNFGAKS